MKYKAYTTLSINVQKGAIPYRIKFSASVNGSSIYVTYDKDIIRALQKHPQYNKAFFPIGTEDVEDEPEETKDAEDDKIEAQDDQQKEEKNDKETIIVEVDSPQDAKDYLREHHNVPVSSMRSKEKIRIEAEKRGIVFKGL